jgi:phosphohistidine phosphatase
MILYFLRHGLAGDYRDWQGDDHKRPLTEEGRVRMGEEAQTIKKLDLGLDLILTSPLLRARQTAEIVAEHLKKVNMAEDERLAPEFDLIGLKSILADHPDAQAIMLVGHEPDFSEMISELTGGTRLALKKGGLARVSIDKPESLEGELEWLLPPRML